MGTVIGIDLGGTKIAIARFDADTFSIQEENMFATHADQSFSHVYEDMLVAIKELSAKDTTAIGVGVPGLVTQPSGTLVTLPNIPDAEKFPLKETLGSDLSLNIEVDNDANCFALAEAMHGAGKGHTVVVGITLGTGVGGGIVVDGTLFRGANGYAAEIGHMLLQPGNPPYDTNDKRGDIEQFLSGSAFGKRCSAAGKPDEYLEGQVCAFMHKDIEKEVAWMCTNIIHLLNPSIIVFGGSAGLALKPHLSGIEQELSKWLLAGTPLPQLVIAKLENAGTLGAALLAR